ncbi:MAG TPA: methylated-DNA--[protein]-cysteine S-methyltransferase [Streptosporangiaceae bacterium]
MSTLELQTASAADARHAPGSVHTVLGSPIGELTLVAADGKLTGLYFPHHWYLPDPASFGPRQDAGFGEAARQLAAYFDGRLTEFDLPAELRGDEFQLRVWRLIGEVGYGQTVSYGELAAELGDGVQARDVGAAVGRNPLSIVVPCHRVVGKDGQLTGYAGGLRRKRFLLDLEQSARRLF